MAKTQAERLAKKCYDDARELLGQGWAHVSPAVRRGLVDSNVLGVLRLQDESTSAEAVLALVRAVDREVDKFFV